MLSQSHEQEKGDIARSLEELIKAHFVSKDFKDIIGSTRLSRSEILILSLMEINRIVSKILSMSESDISDEVLKHATQRQKQDAYELYNLKKRFAINPHAMVDAVYTSFEYMYGLGLQSLDGLSRKEGVGLFNTSNRRILDNDEISGFEKLKRRLTGSVLYYNQ